MRPQLLFPQLQIFHVLAYQTKQSALKPYFEQRLIQCTYEVPLSIQLLTPAGRNFENRNSLPAQKPTSALSDPTVSLKQDILERLVVIFQWMSGGNSMLKRDTVKRMKGASHFS